MKQFTSIKEIDTRLRILRLQREISKEILLSKRQQLQSYFHAPMVHGLLGSGLKRSLVFATASFLLARLRHWAKKKDLTAKPERSLPVSD